MSVVFSLLLQQDVIIERLTGQDEEVKGLLPEVQQAFEKMKNAAAREGIDIRVVSGYRSYERQRQIWNAKYDRFKSQNLPDSAIFDKITAYSTLPGTSRHHWGTDIDIIDASTEYSGDVLVADKFHGNGPFCRLKDWMEKNASDYGFELVYTFDENRPGFEYEPWHYSYAPISKNYLKQFLEKVYLSSFYKEGDIKGLSSLSRKRLQRYRKEHIKGINKELLAHAR